MYRKYTGKSLVFKFLGIKCLVHWKDKLQITTEKLIIDCVKIINYRKKFNFFILGKKNKSPVGWKAILKHLLKCYVSHFPF